ncbi:MAG: lysophospholipid acyltransferase family protein [Bacteroidales bacterium]
MKFLYIIYQWLIAYPIILVATLLTAISTTLGSILGFSRWWGYYPPMLWSKLFCRLMFVSVTVTGRENIDHKTSYLFVSNHQGAYDIFCIYGYLYHDFKWMMKASLQHIPFVGYACKRAGHIFVDRSSPKRLLHTIELAQQTLSGGMSLVVFPEGARTYTGKMRAFKRGAFKLATDFKLPLVPLTINGSFEVLPRTSYQITPGKITLTIHPPIYPNYDSNKIDLDPIMKECYGQIQSALEQKNKD